MYNDCSVFRYNTMETVTTMIRKGRYALLGLLLIVLIFGCSSDETSSGTGQGQENTLGKSANRLSVGESSNDLLDGGSFTRLYLEIHYVEGLRPSSQTVEHFREFLNKRLNKPEGITIEFFELPSPGQEIYTVSTIRDIEDDIRTAYNEPSELKVFGLFLDGEYAENTEEGSVLGIAYRNTSFVIFSETIREFSGQPLSPSTTVLESTVLDHEFGHLMGLVNAGTPLQSEHQDTSHGRHCTAADCLMYWTAETGEGLVNMISGGVIPELDEACLEDLRAHGGK